MEKAKRYRLPTWLDDLLPKEKQPVVIDVEIGGMLWATMPDGTRRELSMDIEKAYDAIGGDEGEDVCFTPAVQERFCDKEYPGLFSPSIGIPSSNGNTRLLMSYTDADRRNCLERGWESFLEMDGEWRNDPSFYNSFHWIDRHPAFWTRACRARPDDDAWQNSNLWSWNTDGYMQRVWVCPGNWGTDSILIALEAGAHVPNEEKWGDNPQNPSRRTRVIVEGTHLDHYHDLRLDVYAQTFEEAVVLLAQKVDKFFDIDGTERSDVEYEKSEIEKTLEERVKDLPEQPKARHIPFYDFAG